MSTTKSYTLTEFKKIQQEQNYRYIGLKDQMGQSIVNYNTGRITVADKLAEIDKKLKSKAVADGVYFICCRNSTKKNAISEDYPIVKGDPSNVPVVAPNAPVIVTNASGADHVLSYSEVLKLQRELSDLTNEKTRLAEKVESLQKEVDDLQADLTEAQEQLSEKETMLAEKEEGGLAERAGTWFKDILAMAGPMIDRHHELQERKLQLRQVELYGRYGMNGNGQPQPKRPPQPQADPNEAAVQLVITKIEEFIKGYSDEPEVYEELAELYNNSENLDDFFSNLKEYDEETFAELTTFINT